MCAVNRISYENNFFLKNHEQNMVEKLFPDPFENIKIKHISGSAAIIFIQFGFIVCPNRV